MQRRLFIMILFVLSGGLLVAQDLPSGQIEVIKDFEVKLAEAKKIRIVPQPMPYDSTARHYEFKLEAPSPDIDYLVPEIKPLAIEPEQKPAYYPLMAKAGYGSPNSLLAAFSYDHVQNDQLAWGLDLHHLSANNKKIDLQKFSTSGGRLNASYVLPNKVKLDGYVDAQFEKLYFYGADEIPANPDAIKQKFNRYDIHLHLANGYAESSDFMYNAHLQLLSDKDNFGSKETGINLGGQVGSTIGKAGYPVGLKLDADLSKLKHTEKHSVNNILASPYFDFFTGHFKMHLGGLALLKKNQNEMLPDLEASYGLFNDLMRIRIGWQGEVQKNNFHYLSEINPYINTRLDSLNNRISRKIYAGIKGAEGAWSYDVTGCYTKFEGMAFYGQNADHPEQFDPIYDNGHYIGVEGSLEYGLLKNVTLRANASQRFYTLDHLNKPYHVPSLDINGMITYTGGSDTYHVSIIFHGENGLPYQSPGGSELRLNPLLDLNLHGDYYITESFGAFAEINNILGNKRERWVNYPSFGFNVKAGILFRLPE